MRTLLTLLLVGLTTVFFAQDISLIDYRDNGDCTTTWTYEVCKGEDHQVSHVTFALCNNPCIFDNGNAVGVIETSDYVELGYDLTTTTCGIKFETNDFDCYQMSFTVAGKLSIGLIDVAVKSGSDVVYLTVDGPDPYNCDCGSQATTLTHFSVRDENGIHVLQWTLENLEDLEKIVIERSVDGHLFREVAVIKDRSVNTFEYLSLNKQSYYRLKIIDIDGSIKYSDIYSMRSSAIDYFNFINNLPIYNSMCKRVTYRDVIPGVYFANFNGQWFRFEVFQ